jgi:coenzyme PQQ precursor peptide PqqA
MPAFQSPAATQSLSNILIQQPDCPGPATPTFGVGRVDRAAALVEHIRYKVIIRIRLSVPRFRFMFLNGRSVVRPQSTWPKERNMSWTTPVIVEVCIGMEVTSYVSAEL